MFRRLHNDVIEWSGLPTVKAHKLHKKILVAIMSYTTDINRFGGIVKNTLKVILLLSATALVGLEPSQCSLRNWNKGSIYLLR
jgi:hypothetical protein